MKQLVIDTWGKIVPLFLIVGLTLAVACSTSTDPDPIAEPEPIEREGTKELTVVIIDRADESGLTGYDIEVTGPVSASAQNVSTSEYVLEDLTSGEYTIEVTLDGYVEASITEEFDVPAETSEDFLAEATVSLRVLTPPVKVNNNEASTVKTGKPDTEDATDDEAVSIQIPANTFPPEVVNEDGSVDLSVTRARPSQSTKGEGGGQISESLILTPTTQLNNTITVTIPIRDIEGLENAEYVLQPGNIPLTSDNSGNLVGKITPGSSAQLVDKDALIDELKKYDVEASNIEVRESDGTSEETYISECGEGLNITYSKDEVEVDDAIAQYAEEAKRKAGAFSYNFTRDARPDRKASIIVSNPTITFTLLVGGTEVGSVTVNEDKVQSRAGRYLDCSHNSGNNPG